MAKRKLIWSYVFLVGLPLLGLVCTLHAGAISPAPMAVRGNWTVEADLNSWRGLSCGKLLTEARQPMFRISQAGRTLAVAINNHEKTLLTGTSVGAILTATRANGEEGDEGAHGLGAGCSDPHPFGLQATVKENGKQRSLAGTFILDGCVACPALTFRAVRQSGEEEAEH